MHQNEPGGLENAPRDSRTATHQDDEAAAPADESGQSRSDLADDGATPSEYRFSTHGTTSKHAPISPVDVDAVYRVLWTLVEDTVVYLDCGDVAQCDEGQSLDLCKTSISRALRLLAEDDQCPLAIERWSGRSTIPTTWRVTAPDSEHIKDGESDHADGGDSHTA